MAALVMALVLVGGWVEIDDAAPRTCLDAAQVETRVAASLGRELPGGSRARVEVRRIGESLGARIDLFDEEGAVSGTREIAARGIRCRQLEDVVVLHLVLALDQTAQPLPAVAVAPQPAPPAAPPAAALVMARAAAPTAALPPPGPDWRFYGGAGGVAGALPGLGFGPLIGGDARWGRLSLAAEGRFDWALPVELSGVRIQSGRAAAGLLACAHPWQLGLCLGPRVGLLRVSRGRSATSPTLDVTGRLTLGLGRSAALYAEPALALVRTRVHADGRRVWTTPPLSLAAGVMIWRQ